MSSPSPSLTGTHHPDGTMRGLHWGLLALCVALFAALRFAWVGHLLVWDEAMTLCTVRAFVSGGEDYFSQWLWRHPPLFSLLMSLLHPLQRGFAERVEVMAILIGILNLLILFRLNQRLFGVSVALASAFFLAVMPGSVFFDVWVKTDHPVTTFGLLAIMLLLANRTFYAGLCLGLAFLFKETALFYAGTVILLWASGVLGRRKLGDFIGLAFIPAVTCCWWYIMVGTQSRPATAAAGGILEHVRLAMGDNPYWALPWNYYAGQLYTDLGPIGLSLALVGLVVAGWQARGLFRTSSSATDTAAPVLRIGTLWPVLLIVPSLIFLSCLKGKVPWIIIVLLPAFATLQAQAMVMLLAGSPVSARSFVRRAVSTGVALAIILLSLAFVYGRDYETVLRKVDAGQWYGASCSREAAETLNRLVRDDERVLLTSFHYWKGINPGDPCAVFSYYYERKGGVLVRSHEARFGELLKEIKSYKLDWALLSPEPGKAEFDLFGGFMTTLKLHPCKLRKAYIFRTQELYASP